MSKPKKTLDHSPEPFDEDALPEKKRLEIPATEIPAPAEFPPVEILAPVKIPNGKLQRVTLTEARALRS